MISTAESLADQLTALIGEIEKASERANRMQSDIDRELSQKYHEIESAEIGAADVYRQIYELKSILQRRRVIKGEAAKMNALRTSLIYDNERFTKACDKNTELTIAMRTPITIEDVIAQ